MLGTNRADTVRGRQGNDHLEGDEDFDFLVGGRGNDMPDGGDGWHPDLAAAPYKPTEPGLRRRVRQ